MISGIITDLAFKKQCPPAIAKMLDLLSDKKIQTLPPGRYEIDANNFYVVMEYTTKDASTVKAETHRKYIDVQVLLSGNESMGWAPLDVNNIVTTPYSDEHDVIYYENPRNLNYLNYQKNDCVIFFHNDIHAGSIISQLSASPSLVRKVVGKVAVSQLI